MKCGDHRVMDNTQAWSSDEPCSIPITP